MKPHKVNLADLPWETFSQGRFGSEDQIVAAAVDAHRLDYVITRLAPGQVSTPYHFHHAGEELFYVIAGMGRLRYAGGERPLRAGDFVSCPPGPDSAHQFINDGPEPLVYWAISTVEPVEVMEYPDSDKVAVVVRHADGQAGFKGVYPRGARVDYWHGET